MMGPVILLVEDEACTADMLQFLLELEGYTVRTASNGTEALKVLQESEPSVVLSDVMMPFMDGLELTRRLQGNPQFQRIPIVLMTAAPHAVPAGLAGAVLPKPLDF